MPINAYKTIEYFCDDCGAGGETTGQRLTVMDALIMLRSRGWLCRIVADMRKTECFCPNCRDRNSKRGKYPRRGLNNG